MENKSDSIVIYWKTLTRKSSNGKDKILSNQSRILSIEEWNSFIELIDENDFWSMKNIFEGVLDGNPWILEGRQGGKYNAVQRVSSRDEEKFYNLCMYIINLTYIDLNAKSEPRIRWLFYER